MYMILYTCKINKPLNKSEVLKMDRVVNILMRRDGYTKEEAIAIVDDCREEMQEAIAHGDYDLAEEIIECDLGLEPDYIMDILF